MGCFEFVKADIFVSEILVSFHVQQSGIGLAIDWPPVREFAAGLGSTSALLCYVKLWLNDSKLIF